MIFCNLVVIKINLRPSERQEQRLPNLRKALDVVCHIMKPLITLILLFLSCLTFGQKDKDFLLSYTDSSSEEGLIGYKTTGGKIIIKAKYSFAYTDTFYKMAIVSKDYHWICINRNEKVILKPFIFDNWISFWTFTSPFFSSTCRLLVKLAKAAQILQNKLHRLTLKAKKKPFLL